LSRERRYSLEEPTADRIPIVDEDPRRVVTLVTGHRADFSYGLDVPVDRAVEGWKGGRPPGSVLRFEGSELDARVSDKRCDLGAPDAR
jgi:hypothetical protein